MMNWIKNRLDTRDDTGAVAIIVGICMFVFIGFTALAVDVGLGYSVDRQHSVTADASALAGAQELGLKYQSDHLGEGCTYPVPSDLVDAADGAAEETYDANDVDGDNDTVTTVVTCDSDDNFLVTVTTSSDVPTVFGGVLNVDMMHPGATATAIVSGSPAYGGLRPYAVCIDDFPGTGAVVGDTYQTVFPKTHNDVIDCNGVPGQWGVMDFDEHSNPNPDIADWTLNGYPGPIEFPSDIDGDPGIDLSGPVRNALDSLVDNETIIMLPVTEGFHGTGDSAEAHAPGVVTAKLCGYSIHPQNGPENSNSCWEDDLYDDRDPEDSKFVFQWQYVEYVPGYATTGSGADGCDLTNTDCVPTTRLWHNP